MKKLLCLLGALLIVLNLASCQQEGKPILNENSLLSNIEVPCEISKENIVAIKTESCLPAPDNIVTCIDDKEQIGRFIDELYIVEVEKIEYMGYGGGAVEVSVKTKSGEWVHLNMFMSDIIRFEHRDFLLRISNLEDLSDEFKRVYLGMD